MADILTTFQRDTDSAIASYSVFYVVNGGPPLPVNIPRTPSGDASGYQCHYSDTAGPDLANGDVVAITGESIDTFGQASPMIVDNPPTITVTIAPPPPPPPTGMVNLVSQQV